MTIITFTVIGIPQPGGSKKAFVLRRRDGSIVTRPNGAPIVNVTDDAKHNASWRNAVAFAAHHARVGAPLLGPLSLTITFTMPRLKSHYRKDGTLKPNAPKYHTVKPDATKLLRSTEDALKGIVWIDDSQIAEQIVTKVYGDRPGAFVQIAELQDSTTVERETTEPAALFAGA